MTSNKNRISNEYPTPQKQVNSRPVLPVLTHKNTDKELDIYPIDTNADYGFEFDEACSVNFFVGEVPNKYKKDLSNLNQIHFSSEYGNTNN